MGSLLTALLAFSFEFIDGGASTANALASCASRPRVEIVTAVENSRLRVLVNTHTSSGVPTNGLSEVRFAQPVNARIVLDDSSTFSSARSISLPGRPTSYVFYIERLADGSATVPLIAVDACGNWQTFVGAGPSLLPAVGGANPADTFEGVPVCTDHNPTTWHALVKRGTDGAILCTYTHEHHDDPNTVNDIFGPVGAWAGSPGQAISYAWQTSSAAGPENQAKHEGYKWHVTRDIPCRPFQPPPDDGCIRAWRIQVHTLGTAADTVVRFHSYSIEARIEYRGRQAIVRHGGWLDTGFLGLIVDGGTGTIVCPPLAGNPSSFQCVGSRFGVGGPRREHSGVNVPAPHTDHSQHEQNWYARHLGTQVQPHLEEWGPTDYYAPDRQLFHPESPFQLRSNNSVGRVENMLVDLRMSWLQPYADANGVIRVNAYTDRDGNPVSDCSSPGVDCVPFMIDGAARASYWYNAAHAGLTTMTEHDVLSPITGRSLIRFPN